MLLEQRGEEMTYIFSIIILWLLATAEAFQGIGHGREVRRDSERGLASRQSAAALRPSAIG